MHIQLVDEELVQQIEQLAAAEQRPPEQIVADALRLYTAQAPKISGVSFLLSIAGQGHSGETDISERAEEILKTVYSSSPNNPNCFGRSSSSPGSDA